jgi:response regulator RpfG family c-di-GMP phosphodiesterase
MRLELDKLKSISVLYVEDDKVLRTQTAGIFSDIFKQVFVASDGQEGLELFVENQNNIDVIISDINMPTLSGLGMAQQIKYISPNIPIVVTTAYTDEEFLLKSISLGIERYILKPLKIKDLAVAIIEIVFRDHISKEQEEITDDCVKSMEKLIYCQKILNQYVIQADINKKKEILYVSQKFLRVFKVEKSDVINSSLEYLIDNMSAIKQQFKDVKKYKKSISNIYKNVTINELLFQLLDITIAPVIENGIIERYIIYFEVL